jgi:penicillin amidase
MSKSIKILGICAGFILLIALMLTAGWLLMSRQALPKTRGSVEVAGLNQPVEIIRDEYGVAHIYAETGHDLFFAQGYVHAQERFWQMEFQRRLAAGRLSEIFGESTLSTDRFLRHFGFHDLAQQAYDISDQESRSTADAYAAGVNAYIQDRSPSKLGLEFALLGLQGVKFEIEEWTPADSLGWSEMLIFDQARGNLFSELDTVELMSAVGSDMTQDLRPLYRQDRPVVIEAQEQVDLTLTEGSAFVGLGEAEMAYLHGLNFRTGLPPALADLGTGANPGSNSFVVSGDLTENGTALLANDTHMSINIPSIWYEVGLHCIEKSPDCPYDLRGFSLSGIPGIVIGHNDRIAWGLTNAAFDAEDMFVEHINPEDPNQYEVNGKWVDMDIRREEIAVKGWEKPDLLFVRSTRNGIIATDELVSHDSYTDGDELFALSQAWTALEPVRTYQAVFMVNQAQNWDEFQKALRFFDAGKQSWIYADVEGNIGFIMPGKVPIRAGGDGTTPVPGWNDDYIWTGFIPYEEAPRAYNPEKGFINSSNNPQLRAEDYPYLLAVYHDRGQRAQRILNMIQDRAGSISFDDMMAIQTDNKSISAEEIIAFLKGLLFEDEAMSNARNRLLNWDAQMHMDSAESALFNMFWRHLIAETYHDQLPENQYPYGDHPTADSVYIILQEPDNPWWDDIRTAEVVEDRDQILVRAFELAYPEGMETFGEDFNTWRWGDLHTIAFDHATLGQSGISLIENLFNRGPFATSGSESVPQKTCWDANNPYQVTCIPSLRQIIDLGDLSNSVMIHSVGQSGHPVNDHYDDFIDPWRLLEYHPTNWQRASLESSTSDRLVLEPLP